MQNYQEGNRQAKEHTKKKKFKNFYECSYRKFVMRLHVSMIVKLKI